MEKLKIFTNIMNKKRMLFFYIFNIVLEVWTTTFMQADEISCIQIGKKRKKMILFEKMT